MTTNKINQILHQSVESSHKYLLRRTIEKYDGSNTPKYKIIPADYMNRNKPSNNKYKLYLVIKILDHMITRPVLENESSYFLNRYYFINSNYQGSFLSCRHHINIPSLTGESNK